MLIQNAVPIADVAAVTKLSEAKVRAECEALQLFVGQDWAGRPAVTQDDAAGLVSGSTRREQDQRAEWMEHLRLTEQWEQDRRQALWRAERSAYQAAMSRGISQPAAAGEAREAAQEAAERFEADHPVPLYNGEPTTSVAVTRRPQGVLSRVKAALS